MRRGSSILRLALASLLLLSLRAQAQVTEVTVPIGKTSDGFSFSTAGALSYKGKPFNPAVQVKAESVQSFRISLRGDKGFAGAIAEDGDGQNSAYLLNLGSQTATPLQKAGTWSAAQQLFWSPSGRYMLALCSSEGQRFIGVNLQTEKVIDGDFLGPKGKLWTLTDTPRWPKGSDKLVFTVNETCNPFDASNCDPEKVLARYTVSLDPATLKTTAQKVTAPSK